MKIFLDLEGTIIDSIESGRLMHKHIYLIRKSFPLLPLGMDIETFSFALIDDRDFAMWQCVQAQMLDFNMSIKTQSFNVRELEAEFIRDMFGASVRPENVLMEYCGFLRKDLIFEWWITKNNRTGEFWLFDDVVESKTITKNSDALTIRLFKIKDLVKQGYRERASK